MKNIKDIRKIQLQFLRTGMTTISLALIGLTLFFIGDIYLIHPTIYILILIMGIGWVATALVSIYNDKKKERSLK